MVDLGEIPEEPTEPCGQEEGYLPSIYEVTPSRNFKKKMQTTIAKKKQDENLMIYKDFDTSLTAVKTAVNRLPRLGQTTSQRPEDMIRDRLLSFNVKNGKVTKLGRDSLPSNKVTINDKTKMLQS